MNWEDKSKDMASEARGFIKDIWSWRTRRKEFYNSVAWRRKRRIVRNRDHRIDVWHYILTGEIRESEIVHHIVSIADDFDMRLETENLVSLSKDSHGTVESIYNLGAEHKRKCQELLRRAVKLLPYLVDIEDTRKDFSKEFRDMSAEARKLINDVQSEEKKMDNYMSRNRKKDGTPYIKEFYKSRRWESIQCRVLNRDYRIDVWKYIKTGKAEFCDNPVIFAIVPLMENFDLREDVGNFVTVSQESAEELKEMYLLSPVDRAYAENLLRQAVKELEYLLNVNTDEDWCA